MAANDVTLEAQRILRDILKDSVVSQMTLAHEKGVSVDLIEDFPPEVLVQTAVRAVFGLSECMFMLAAEIDELRTRLAKHLQDHPTTPKKVN